MTPLPPPPRRVRRPPSVGRKVGWLSLAVVALATLALGLALANELAYRFLGHDVPAALTSLHEHPDGDGGYTRVARYTYSPGPGYPPRADSARLDHRLFRELQKPFLIDTIPDDVTFPPDRPGVLAVRAYTLGPIAYGRPVQHEHHALFLLIPALAFPIALLLAYLIYRGLVIRDPRLRRLFTHGVAVPGTITARHEDRDAESLATLADYTYTPAGAADPITGAIWLITTAAYEHATVGRRVTVLYDPAAPARSTVYEYGPFRAA